MGSEEPLCIHFLFPQSLVPQGADTEANTALQFKARDKGKEVKQEGASRGWGGYRVPWPVQGRGR